jgi:predicted AAA+ superfamily ATPase
MPAVVLTGARQTGKSTLASRLTGGRRTYRTLDDMELLGVARQNPQELLQLPGPLTLGEVQRAPDLLLAIKRAIDLSRIPGQFLLTGSANLMLMQRVSESLAGRASYLTLWPMTRREQLGLGCAGRWDDLLATPQTAWRELLGDVSPPAEQWQELAARGGFPTPALHLSSAADRERWFEGYVRTYLERDLQSLSAIAALPDFRRLMRIAAMRVGQMINQTEIGRDAAIAQATAHRYLNLLETSYMLVRLPAYASNRTKRLIKTPKLYWCDVGLGVYLSGSNTPSGAHLENLILHDLLAWRETLPRRAEIMYWRTSNGEEVDFVVETTEHLLAIEVKATANPRISDAANLGVFLHEYADRNAMALLLHTGEAIEWLAPNVLAVPWWRVI